MHKTGNKRLIGYALFNSLALNLVIILLVRRRLIRLSFFMVFREAAIALSFSPSKSLAGFHSPRSMDSIRSFSSWSMGLKNDIENRFAGSMAIGWLAAIITC